MHIALVIALRVQLQKRVCRIVVPNAGSNPAITAGFSQVTAHRPQGRIDQDSAASRYKTGMSEDERGPGLAIVTERPHV